MQAAETENNELEKSLDKIAIHRILCFLYHIEEGSYEGITKKEAFTLFLDPRYVRIKANSSTILEKINLDPTHIDRFVSEASQNDLDRGRIVGAHCSKNDLLSAKDFLNNILNKVEKVIYPKKSTENFFIEGAQQQQAIAAFKKFIDHLKSHCQFLNNDPRMRHLISALEKFKFSVIMNNISFAEEDRNYILNQSFPSLEALTSLVEELLLNLEKPWSITPAKAYGNYLKECKKLPIDEIFSIIFPFLDKTEDAITHLEDLAWQERNQSHSNTFFNKQGSTADGQETNVEDDRCGMATCWL